MTARYGPSPLLKAYRSWQTMQEIMSCRQRYFQQLYGKPEERKPMTTEEAFLADIIANRDDDTPRLIFADYLDYEGQPERGEFIRLQCERAKLCCIRGEDCFCSAAECEHCALVTREREILATPAGTRFRPDCCYGFPCTITFRRGFVAKVECPAEDFLTQAEAILKRCPIEEVTLTTWPQIQVVCSHERRMHGTEIELRRRAIIHWGKMPRLELNLCQRRFIDSISDQYIEREMTARMQDHIDNMRFLGAANGWFPGIKFNLPEDRPDVQRLRYHDTSIAEYSSRPV